MKQGFQVDLCSVKFVQCANNNKYPRSVKTKNKHVLIHDDTDRIVQKTLSEDDIVQLRVDLILIEYREDGHWVRRR